MRVLAVAALLLPIAALAGCASPPAANVREIALHIGYSSDRSRQYAQPPEVQARQGEAIRFVITNDDREGAPDSFHDIAFRYGSYGLLEHEVPAGKTTKTCVPQAEPDQACPAGKDSFVASEAGRFKMWCEVGSLGKNNADGTPQTRHEQMGMWATLVVS